MAWRAISESDILTCLSGPELDAFREAALGSGQEDPIDDAISQVTDVVRGYCAGNPRNTLGSAGTIPDVLLGPALDILLINIQSRAAGTIIDPSDERRKKADRAYAMLKDVAAGKFALDDASTDGEYQSGGGAVRVTTNTSRVSRTNLAGF